MKGCFHCQRIFEETKIKEYTKEANGKPKPICPICGVDSVVNLQEALFVLHHFYFQEYEQKKG